MLSLKKTFQVFLLYNRLRSNWIQHISNEVDLIRNVKQKYQNKELAIICNLNQMILNLILRVCNFMSWNFHFPLSNWIPEYSQIPLVSNSQPSTVNELRYHNLVLRNINWPSHFIFYVLQTLYTIYFELNSIWTLVYD